LFLSLLDSEWPELGKDLIEKVWPAYRACWREAAEYGRPSDGRVSIRYPDEGSAPLGWRNFAAPAAVWSFPLLRRSRVCADLRRALFDWAQSAGRGLRDDWLLESALVSLGQYPPSEKAPRLEFWRYSDPFHGRVHSPVFVPRFTGTRQHPNDDARWLPHPPEYYGTWTEFKRRMRSQFDAQLSEYRKVVMAQCGVEKGNYHHYARWTVARLSGLTWPEIVERYQLQRLPGKRLGGYTDGETQCKKGVRAFAAEIGVTLAKTLAANGKEVAKKRYE
jgi:hypothetical protein